MAQTANTHTLKTNWPNGYKVAMAQFTRPADAIVYSAGDQVSGSTGSADYLLFAEARAAGSCILQATLTQSSPAAMDFDLLLFDGSSPPASAAADNAALTIGAADMQNLVGMIAFRTANKATSGIDIYRGMDVSLAAYSPLTFYGNLYGLLVARTAIALGNAASICIRLAIDGSSFAVT